MSLGLHWRFPLDCTQLPLRRSVYALVVLTLALALAACASQPAPSTTGQSSGSNATTQPAAAPTQVLSVPGKALNMAMLIEPSTLGGKIGSGRSGLDEYAWLFAAALIRIDAQGNPVPILGEQIPSLENGTWKVFDDRRMETTYTLRPNVTWHDGTPLTSDDVVFTFRAIVNPEVPALDRVPERSIESVDAIDPRTFVVRWKESNIYGNSYQLEPLPRHILEPILQRDPQAFVNSTYWTREWVGLGPYRVTDWVAGSHLRGQAFDNYVLGAPRIQDVFVYFISDANQAVARFLAGGLDLSLGSLIRVEEGVTLKSQLEQRNEGTVISRPEGGVRSGELQFREPQNPAARDLRVRQALLHALDRKLLIDSLQFGLAQPAHMLLAPGNAAYDAADRAVTRYEYSLERAQQLLSQAGWSRGGDGFLRNAEGERFDFGVRVTEGSLNNKEGQAVADMWKTIGVNPEVEILPRSRQEDQQFRALYPGIALGSPTGVAESLNRYTTDAIPTEGNNWRGNNRGGWSSPAFDRLARDYFRTLELGPRNQTHVQAVKLITDELPLLHLYYQVDVYGVRNGLKGVSPTGPGDGWTTFNAHRLYWER